MRRRELPPKKAALARRLLREGELTTKEIAARLGISKSLMYKLMPSPRTTVTGRRKAVPTWYKKAADLLASEDITAAEVARRLGVKKGSIYHHFPREVRDKLQEQRRQKS